MESNNGFSNEELKIRSDIQTAYDFFEHCRKCDNESHCCNRPGNVVIIKNSEIPLLEKRFNETTPGKELSDFIKPIEGCDSLFFLKPSQNALCLMFTNEKKCAVHDCKPLDCLMWPVTYNSNNSGKYELELLDSECNAVNSENIDEKFFHNIQKIDCLLTEEEKKVYSEECIKSYKMYNDISNNGRLIKMKSNTLGITHFKVLLHNKYKNSVKIIENVNCYLKSFLENIEIKTFDAKNIIKATKWILGITIALLIEYAFQLSHKFILNDSNALKTLYSDSQLGVLFYQNKYLIKLIIPILLMMFIFDAVRIIMPLPFYYKRLLDLNKEDATISTKVPVSQTLYYSLVTIITIYLMFLISQSFYDIKIYILCVGIILGLDTLWYINVDYWPTNLKHKYIKKKIKKEFDRLSQIELNTNNKVDIGLKRMFGVDLNKEQLKISEKIVNEKEEMEKIISEKRKVLEEKIEAMDKQIEVSLSIRSAITEKTKWNYIAYGTVIYSVLFLLLSNLIDKFQPIFTACVILIHIVFIGIDILTSKDEYKEIIQTLYFKKFNV